MQIRRYQAHDLNEVLALFQQTVRQVNVRDYSTAQIKAWLGTDSVTVHQHWQQRLLTTTTMVILDGQKLIAFGNILATGYLDCLYVHTEYQRQGLAKWLVTTLEASVSVTQYTVAASITAVPFFVAQGYHVIRRQEVVRAYQVLTNFFMIKASCE